MIKSGVISCLVVATILVFNSCNRGPIGPGLTPLILSGTVKDQQGTPIAGAGVHYVFGFAPDPLGKTLQVNPPPTTMISFTLPKPGHVRVSLLRWYTRQLLAVLLDTTQAAGTHYLGFDTAPYTNGVYIYQLVIDSSTTESRIQLLNPDLSTLAASTPLTVSDASGQFVLPYELLGIGLPVTQNSSSGSVLSTVYISHTISVIIVKQGFQTIEQSLTLPPSDGLQRTFVLPK